MLCHFDLLVVDFVRECHAWGVRPSYRDVQRYFGLGDHQDVGRSMSRLQRAGLLHCAGHKGRRIEIHNLGAR